MTSFHPSTLSTSLCCFILCGIVGCASSRPTPPPQWPKTFSNRQLFFTLNVLVYARTGSAADRAAERMTDIDRQFKDRTHTDPAPGLIVVNDVEDSSVGNLKLELSVPPDEKKSGKLDELGITLQDLTFAMTLPIQKDQLSREAGFTASALQTIQWSAATPTDRRMNQFEDHLIDAGMKKQNLNLFQRMILLPFMPLLHGLLNDAMNAEQDTLFYQCLCKAQPGWSEERRKKESEDYEAWRMGEAVKSLKAATQQVKDADK